MIDKRFFETFGINKTNVINAFQEYIANSQLIAETNARNDYLKEYLGANHFRMFHSTFNGLIEFKLSTKLFDLVKVNKYHLETCKNIKKEHYYRKWAVSDYNSKLMFRLIGAIAKCCEPKTKDIISRRINRLTKEERFEICFNADLRRSGITRLLDWSTITKIEEELK